MTLDVTVYDLEHDLGRDCERDCGRNFGRDFGHDSAQDSGVRPWYPGPGAQDLGIDFEFFDSQLLRHINEK